MSTIAMPTPTYALRADLSSLVIRPPYIRSRSTLLNQRLATSVTIFFNRGRTDLREDWGRSSLFERSLVATSRSATLGCDVSIRFGSSFRRRKKRLALMSQLLDPMHRRQIESLGISREARVLEVGCGNGSMSAWMAEHSAPDR